MNSVCRVRFAVVVVVAAVFRFIAAFIFVVRKYLCMLTFDRYNRSTQQFALLYVA